MRCAAAGAAARGRIAGIVLGAGHRFAFVSGGGIGPETRERFHCEACYGGAQRMPVSRASAHTPLLEIP